MLQWKLDGKRVCALQGDITEVRVDAIVNAANEALRGGGGVDGAIHRKGGPQILEECKRYPGLPTGQAVLTTAGRLPAGAVIHTVGPIWRGGAQGEEQLLRSAYRSSLQLAAAQGLRSIAFPSISTGAYGYPLDRACPVAVDAALEHLAGETSLEEVRFVLYAARDLETYQAELERRLGAQGEPAA